MNNSICASHSVADLGERCWNGEVEYKIFVLLAKSPGTDGMIFNVEINLGCFKLMKSDSKYMWNVTKAFYLKNTVLLIFLFVKESWKSLFPPNNTNK